MKYIQKLWQYILMLWLIPIVGTAASNAYTPRTMNAAAAAVDGDAASLTLTNVVTNIVTVLQFTIVHVATAVFIYGAFLYAASMEKDEVKNEGKQFMIGAMIGTFTVLSARAILRLTILIMGY